jgi:hypothetical protein
MMQPWIGERMTEEHRRDLTAIGPSAGRPGMPAAPPPVDGHQPLAASSADAGDPAWHRPFGHHIGTLLIRAGTRLGGATMTTS